MKKATIAILSISLLASCKKCYKCTTTITNTSSSYHEELVNEYEYCTKKKDDLYNEERRGTTYAPGGAEEKTVCDRNSSK
jgi:hypothetical protein